jgi:hypothetical protein
MRVGNSQFEFDALAWGLSCRFKSDPCPSWPWCPLPQVITVPSPINSTVCNSPAQFAPTVD